MTDENRPYPLLTDDEKRTLLIHVMEDIRGAFDLGAGDRTQAVLDLATDLGYEHVREYAQGYRDLDDYRDGRYFRTPWRSGGYESPPFPVTRTRADSSEALIDAVYGICEYPEYRLEDDQETYA